MRRTKAKPGLQKLRRSPLLMALEPRIMFDGAGAATAHEVHVQHHDATASVAAAPHIADIEARSDMSDHLRQLATSLRTAQPEKGPAVVFVDSRVEDAASLLKGVTAGTEIVYLQANHDGLQQMATYLSHHHEVGSVEIIAHGGNGDLLLGSTDVNAENLGTFSRALGEIGSNLRTGADILLYACNTGHDARGVGFVDALARDTGHVVAASSNVTGSGGDWNLEITTGMVTATSVLAKSSEAHYAHTLGTTAVSTAAQLNAAILADDLDLLGNDTITLTSNITYASAADAATIAHLGTGTLTIDGGGFTINAAYLSRVLTVTAGNVVLENVTLEHGLLAGAGGALSLNGVSEMGAGIFNAGTLTLNNVLVTQNVATAGGGGGTGVVGAGGGGGSGAGGIGGAAGGGIGSGLGVGSSGGKGSGTGGGLGGTSSGGGGGGVPTSGGSSGGSGATASSSGLTVGAGGGGTGYVAGNGGAGGSAAGGIYNAGTGKLYVIGTSAITNNLGAAGGGGGGIGVNVVNLVTVPFHGGAGGQGVGGIWNATTGQVFISSGAYNASTGNVGSDGTIGSAINGGSNAGIVTAAAANKINTSGTISTNYVAPAVTSISLVGSSPSNAGSDAFVVTFSEAVSGVNALDFSLANTGTVAGIIAPPTGSGTTYTVLVNPVTGDGTMGLLFNPITPIVDSSGTAVVGSFTTGPVYTVDHTPPVATSITTVGVSPNSGTSEQFTVNFSENVIGVDVGDFNLVNTGTVGGAIASVVAVNGKTYTVTVNNVTGNGTMQLNLNASGTGIVDTAGNAIVGGSLLDQPYTITHTLPVVTSIITVGNSTNNALADSFIVNFSENVTGVNVADFSLTNTQTAGGVIASVTGSGSTYTVNVDPVFGDGTMRLNFNAVTPVVDSTGNLATGSFTAGQTYTIEHTPPIVTSIVATAGDSGSAGSEQFTVNFSENVTGVDASDFTLAKTGTVGGTISSVTGGGSSYTVTVGGVSGDGTLAVNLNASGTGITDAATNPIAGGALGQVYVIEHTPPTALSITGPSTNPNNAPTDQFTVTFSENVGGVDANDFTLFKTGTVAGSITAVTAVSPDANGRASVYTVTVGSVTGDGTMQIALNATGTGITDSVGNAIVGGAASPIYGIEHTLPVVTSIATVGNSTNNAGSDQFVVTFSESVTNVSVADFSLTNTNTAGGVITSVTGSGTTYTVLVNPVGGDGTMRLNFANNTAVIDSAGNLASGPYITGQVYTVDHTPPVATSIVATAGDSASASSEQFTVNFSENVSGVDASDFTLAKIGTVGGSIASVVAVNPNANGLASSYTVTVNGVTGIGSMQLNLNGTGTGIKDAVGNSILLGAAGPVYGISHTLPTVSSIVLLDPATNNAGSESFQVNFSENVSGVNAADFSLTNTNTAGGVITSVTANTGSSYTVLVSPSFGDGTMRLDLNPLTTIVDATGNTTAGGYTSGPAYTIEHTPPVALSIATVPGANPNHASTETYTVTFSEAVGGLAPGDFAIATTGNASASVASITAVSPDAAGRSSTYTVVLGSVAGNGTLQLNLNGSGTNITDAAGNAIVGGAVGGIYGVQHTLPVVTSIATVGANPNNADSDQFTVTFSENVTGVNAADFIVDAHGTVGTITSVTGSGNTYTVLVSPVTGSGTLGVDFAPNTVILDAAGNQVTGTFVGQTYTVDHTPPAALSIVAASNDSSASTSDQFVVSFSENVTSVNAGDFTLVTTGGVTGTITSVMPINPVNGMASSYSVSVDGVRGTGTLQVNLNAGTGIADSTGNLIVSGMVGPLFTVNAVAPSVTSITLVDAATNNLSSEQFTVTFSEVVGGVTAGDFVLTKSAGVMSTIDGTVTAVDPDVLGNSNQYIVTVDNVSGNGTMRLDLSPSESGITDTAGNMASGGYTGGASYTIDHTPPSVTSIALNDAATNMGGSESFTVTFSENVSAPAAGDFVLAESGVTGSIASITPVNPDANNRASSYVVTVTGVNGNGTLQLNLSNSQTDIADAAGNHLSGGYTSTVAYTIDQTAPTVASFALVEAAKNDGSSEDFKVTFSEDVSGLTAGDFVLTNGATVTGSVTSITAVGPLDANGRAMSYIVTATGVTGDGSMHLDLSTSQTGITDAAGNAVSGGYTSAAGVTYTIDHTPPTAVSITPVGTSPTDGTSEQFTVVFSEPVTGVTAGDFSAAVGGTVTDTGITVSPTSGYSDTYTVTVNGVTGNGSLGLNLRTSGTAIADAAGNTIQGGFSSGGTFTIDNMPPAVSSIALVDAATNNLGSEHFTITFSENVTAPTASDFVLTKNGVMGSITSITAVNPDTSGRASSYTVTVGGVSGNGTMHLDLSASETGITDAAGNSMAGGYTSGASVTYTIDHLAPTVSSVSLVGNATNNANSEQFTVQFSEDVSKPTAGDFLLTNGGNVTGSIASIDAVGALDANGRASSYTVTVTGVSGDGSMHLDLNSSPHGISDAAGNVVAGGYTSPAAVTYTIEHSAPTVASIALVDAATNDAHSEQFTVSFSENVSLPTTGDFLLSMGGSVTGSITSIAAIGPLDANNRASSYLVTVTGVNGDGSMHLDLSASQNGITDIAGNAVIGGYTSSAAVTYSIDHTAPTVSSIALVESTQNNGSSENFTVTFSENVSGLSASDFVLANGGNVTGSITSITPVGQLDANGRANSYTVTVGGVTGAGSMHLDLIAGQTAISDAAGNTEAAGYTSSAAVTYEVDHTVPAVASISLLGSATNNSSSELFQVNFSESVSTPTSGDFVVTTDGTVSGTITSITPVGALDANGRATAYTVTVGGSNNPVTGDGTMRLDLSAAQSGITDAAGNAVAGGYAAGASYTIEHTAPVVSSITLADSASNDNLSEHFTVNFSESVSTPVLADFTLTDGSGVMGMVTNVTAINPDSHGRASSYEVTVGSVSGTGTMRLDFSPSTTGIADAAGNTVGAAFTAGQVYQLGAAVPAVQSITTSGKSTNNGSSEQFVVNFSEDVTHVDAGDFLLTTTGTASGTVAAVTGSGSVYTVTVDNVAGDGTLRLDLNGTGTGIVDSANHPIASGFTSGQVYTIDHTAPTVIAIDTTGSSPNNATTEQFTVQFSEHVTGVGINDFVLAATGTAAGTIGAISGSGSTYTITVTGVSGDGTLRLDLNAGSDNIRDGAGNAASAAYALGQTITVDHTPPAIASITPTAGSPNNAASETFTVTFSEDVTGVSLSDFALIGTGTAAGTLTSVTGSGRTYTVTVSNVTGDGTLRIQATAAANGVTDSAGNVYAGGTQTGSPTTVDHTPPTITSVSTVGSNPNNAGSEQYTITFSESVTGVAVDDFTLVTTGTAAGKITAVSGSGTTYVVTVSDVTGDGTIGVNVNASGTAIADKAGNPVNGGYDSGSTYMVDHSPPAVQSVTVPPSGTYTTGQSLAFTVNYDEPVKIDTAGGTPRLVITLADGTTEYATYAGGSGTDHVTFVYVVGANDHSSGVAIANTIDLHGGTITDLAGNSGQSTLVNLGSTSGLTVGSAATAVMPDLLILSGEADGEDAAQFVQGYPLAFEPAHLTLDTVTTVLGTIGVTLDDVVLPSNSMSPMVEPVNTSFSFSIPLASFQFDPGSIVVVNAAMADGRPLPGWLHFDPSNGKFEGDAPAVWNEHLHIVVTARDQAGHEVMVPIEIAFTKPGADAHSTPHTASLHRAAGGPVGHRAHRQSSVAAAGKDSLATQFARYGRHAQQRAFNSLVNRI